MFAVERRELGGVIRWKTAGSSVLWIVEPEPYMEGIGGWQGYVRIEAEDVLFTLGATEPKRATTAFAKALAQQTALLAIEKYFPNGVEPSLCTRQIDHLPVEFENRLPDLCVNGNTAWLP